MQNCIKNDGYCIRWGGEEFLILFPKLSVAEAEPLMEKLLEEVRSLNMDYQGSSLSVTMTFGLCSCLDCNSSDELVKKADSLLYYGKEHGRNQLVLDVCDNENS